MLSAMDPGFPRGGAVLLLGQIFPKLPKNEENWARGTRLKLLYVDPLLVTHLFL